MDAQVLVVGAGPAGLATAAVLSGHGVRVKILEQGAGVATSWRTRYDGLRLNTWRQWSQLPGFGMDSRCGYWVGRDEYVEYLERYAIVHRLRVRPNLHVDLIDRASPAGWCLHTSDGPMLAPAVVIATGAFAVPFVPEWPSLDKYRGRLLHAADYCSPDGFDDSHVLVVGSGASGLEIALQLSEGGAARVDLSVRSGRNLFPRELHHLPLTLPAPSQRLPIPVLDAAGRLVQRMLGTDWPHPLPAAESGIGTAMRRDGTEPVVADAVVEALRDGRIGMVPPVHGFTENDVVLTDGPTLQPDAVIAATGYRTGLEPLVGHLGVLDACGRPWIPDGMDTPGTPGLVFVAFEPTVTGKLVQIPRVASRAAATVARTLTGGRPRSAMTNGIAGSSR